MASSVSLRDKKEEQMRRGEESHVRRGLQNSQCVRKTFTTDVGRCEVPCFISVTPLEIQN